MRKVLITLVNWSAAHHRPNVAYEHTRVTILYTHLRSPSLVKAIKPSLQFCQHFLKKSAFTIQLLAKVRSAVLTPLPWSTSIHTAIRTSEKTQKLMLHRSCSYSSIARKSELQSLAIIPRKTSALWCPQVIVSSLIGISIHHL